MNKNEMAETKRTEKILQCGYPKSGNYLLWEILQKCQKIRGVYRSFSVKSGISDLTKKVYKALGLKPYFSKIFDLDEVEEKAGRMFFYKVLREDDVFNSFIEVDFDLLFSVSSLIWTHTTLESLNRHGILNRFGLRFYILRDGRAAVSSFVHHVVRKEALLLHPIYKYHTPEEAYGDLSLFKKYVSQWKTHVNSFLHNKDKFTLIRFEDLTQNKSGFKNILSLFGLEDKLDNFIEEFSFCKMKKYEPTHVRKGDNQDWKSFFTHEHKDAFKSITGNLLIELGYEKNNNW